MRVSLSLSLLSRLALPALAILSITTGLIAGGILRTNHQDSSAASANIEVADNDQLITEDQSTGELVIQRFSTVTVKNPMALIGYTLSATIDHLDLPSATVTIASTSSTAPTTCLSDSPCTLSTTPQPILTTSQNIGHSAATQQDTSNWTVTITVPVSTNLGAYTLDIAYTESQNPISSMQNFSTAKCASLTSGTTIQLYDERDYKVYRIKKMVDDRCWMIDNLAYDLANSAAPAFDPAPALNPATSTHTAAQYAQNTTDYDISNGNSPTPTYLYNWCAALGDTSLTCSASKNATNLQTVIGGAIVSGTTTTQPEVTGICPAPFRLPKGGPIANPANDGTNTIIALASTANEFVKLDIAMGGLGTNRPSADTLSLFLGSDVSATNWDGVLSGDFYNGLRLQDTHGVWLSSTASGSNRIYLLNIFTAESHEVHPAYSGTGSLGRAVRCLL